MEQHNGTTYENVWGVTFGDRLEEEREEWIKTGEARGEKRGIKKGVLKGSKKREEQVIRRMIRLGYDDKAIQAAVGIADVNEIKTIRKRIMS